MLRLDSRVEVVLAGFGMVGIFGLMIAGISHDRIREEMRACAALARGIPALMVNPKSAETAIAQERRQAELERAMGELRAAMSRINRRAPLLAGLFPNQGPAHRRLRFVELYRDAIDGFTKQLRAGKRRAARWGGTMRPRATRAW
jgi:hypothetical protein